VHLRPGIRQAAQTQIEAVNEILVRASEQTW
jgi:hypothetical protein